MKDFKDYDELRDYLQTKGEILQIVHLDRLLNYIEMARDFGYDEGEQAGFREAVNKDFDNLDIEDIPDDLLDEIETNAYDRGRDDGYQNGFDDGRNEGYDEGHQNGYNDGYDECRTELGVD